MEKLTAEQQQAMTIGFLCIVESLAQQLAASSKEQSIKVAAKLGVIPNEFVFEQYIQHIQNSVQELKKLKVQT